MPRKPRNNKKELDYFDATNPQFEDFDMWVSDLLYNGRVVGSVVLEDKELLEHLIKRWVYANKRKPKRTTGE